MLVEQIANITSNKTKWFKIPMVVCGDFNSQPDSGPYELLGTGRIKAHHQGILGTNFPYTIKTWSLLTTASIQHMESLIISSLEVLMLLLENLHSPTIQVIM